MAYCTQDDLLYLISGDELAELTIEIGDVPDSDVVTEAIAQADALINSYLAIRYTLPLATTPDQVRALSVAITIYKLMARRTVMPEVRAQEYKDAVAFLKDVAAGCAEVIGATGAEEATSESDIQEIASSTRVFSRTLMGDW